MINWYSSPYVLSALLTLVLLSFLPISVDTSVCIVVLFVTLFHFLSNGNEGIFLKVKSKLGNWVTSMQPLQENVVVSS